MKKYLYIGFFALLAQLLTSFCYAETPQRSMFIVIPSYNNEQFAKRNINSVIQQKYTNFKVVYINDCSTDNTAQIIQSEIKKAGMQDKIKIINNSERKGALRNIYEAVTLYSNDQDIIVLLDGDDGFDNDFVLSYLNKVYQNEQVWLTYGQFREINSGNIGFCSPIPTKIVKNNDYRNWHHIPSHLRTFYSWLFKKIQIEDLMYEGEFFKMTWDMAIMLPMIEMTGGRFKFIPKVLYSYNDNNPISDHRIDKDLQRNLDLYVRSKPKYEPLAAIKEHKEVPMERFAIIIASYNNEEYCINNIESAISQDYPQFKVIFIDDCSNDKTFSIVDRYIKEHAFDLEVRVIRNTVRKGAAQNYYEAIHNYTDNGEIIVILDGDDEFAHPYVLKKLNEVYRSPDKDIWLTYGQFINKSDGSLGFCSAYPEEVQKRGFYRHYHHIPSHLKTFKSWLFKKILKNDFMYKGSFMPMTWDMASMIPMMEMAGEKHHQFIPEVLYIYNDLNPSSDHRISKKLQMEIDEYIRARRSYRAVADEPKNCR